MGDKPKSKKFPNDFRKDPKFCHPFRFHNQLPMVPCEQKLMAYPFDQDRFTKYSLTSLEANYTPPLLLPLDLGIPIDLINPEIYNTPPDAELLKEDAELLEEPKKDKEESKANKYSASNSSLYLRKSTLPAGPIVYSNPTVQEEAKNEADVEAEYDTQTWISKICSAFEKNEFVHPTKPGLKAEKVYSVFPDLSYIHTEFVMFVYDEEPHEKNKFTVLKEHEDEEADPVMSIYVEEEPENTEEMQENEKSLVHLRNYKYSYFNDPNQNDILLWIDEDKGVAAYAQVENKLQLKKKKVPKGITSVSTSNLPSKLLNMKIRDERKSEILARKNKLLEFECPLDPGMESDKLEEMAEEMDQEKEEKMNMFKRLFGGDDSDEEML
ncbi:unnamed protein product [Blepharisma stoltei]|uniref:RNA polymerase II-associated factor 1 homolog n=1 Tax=Blepharisma stoltei TaxID=1481888 RepID=A0AAU9IFH7_9CILI|nr:unnamed protein product [Blepharisma stoltei]